MGLWQILTKKKIRHGIYPDEHKERTRHLAIRRLPFAPRLHIPLSQHIGAAAKILVTPGQEVQRGEIIATADGFLSTPIHAPATGVIEAIRLMPTVHGEQAQTIILKVYQADCQDAHPCLSYDVETLSADDIIKATRDCGIVGLGGATFPTHAKMSIPKGSHVDTLVVNGCECEPYLTTDHRIMLEHTDALIAGIRLTLRAINAGRAIIGVEDNKADAIAAIKERLKPDDAISVQAVRSKYPQGAEKLLLKSLLGREVPAGGYSYDVGVYCNNVGTLAQLGELLPKGLGLIERVVTVDGPEVKQPGNYIIPLGTPIRFVLEQVGVSGDHCEVILGGPMMGTAVASLDVPITKGVSGLLVFNKAALTAESQKTYPCIKCGQCVKACPMNLNPTLLGLLAAKQEYAEMEQRYHLNKCFECGCCTYVCPARIPIVQYLRIAKAVNRETRQRENQQSESARQNSEKHEGDKKVA